MASRKVPSLSDIRQWLEAARSEHDEIADLKTRCIVVAAWDALLAGERHEAVVREVANLEPIDVGEGLHVCGACGVLIPEERHGVGCARQSARRLVGLP